MTKEACTDQFIHKRKYRNWLLLAENVHFRILQKKKMGERHRINTLRNVMEISLFTMGVKKQASKQTANLLQPNSASREGVALLMQNLLLS